MMVSLNKTRFFLLFMSFILVLSTLTTYSVAETIDVCSSGCQYNSIQYAINNAKDGDKIYVKEGVYKEHLVLNDRSVTLMGENRDSTIIDGSGSGICVHIINANVTVTELSLKNCNGVRIGDGSHAIIYHNLLDSTSSSAICSSVYSNYLEHAGIYNSGGSSKIYDNIIQNNKHGIVFRSGAVNNEIYDNIIENNCGGITLIDAKITEIFRNKIKSNKNNGVRVDISNNITLYENNILMNTEMGIAVYFSTINAYDNNLSSSSKGVYLHHSELSEINNNTFVSNRYGIYLKQSEKNEIKYNHFRDSITTDISLIESAYNTVKYNYACNIESTESNDIGYNICPDDPLELPDQKAHSVEIIHETKENTSAKSKRITVCYTGCQFSTIQDAINNAKDNDEIYVKEGVYKEHLVLNDKSITLWGENRDSTIIDGEGHGSCIDIASHSNVLISEITLKNCNGIAILVSSKAVVSQTKILGLGHDCLMDSEAFRFGIFISNSSAKIYDNIIQNNQRGILIAHSDNNKLYDNHIEDNCYGVFLSQAKRTKVFRNAIQLNRDSGIFLETSWDTNIFENDIINNTGSGISVSSSSINVSHNNLTGNSNGIYLMGGWGSLINNNRFIFNTNAIVLKSSRNNTIEYNLFRCNQRDISFSQSENNDVWYNYACNIAYTESNNIENNHCLNDRAFCIKTKTSVIKDDKKDNVIIEESDTEEDIFSDLIIFLFLVAICVLFYRKNKRKKEELKRKKMEDEIRKKLEEKRRKKEKEDIRIKKEQEEEKRKKLEEKRHKKEEEERCRKKEQEERKRKKEEDEKRKFEEKQRAKGLVKYKDDIWLKPEALEHLKKIEIGLDNNFQDYTPYDFEKFIAKLFEKMGYISYVTKKTGDYGVDIVAKKGKDTVAIQAKKYRRGNNVGNVDVQKILGAMWKYDANKAMIITTSDFTVQAESQAKGAPVELWDRHTLHDMAKLYLIDKEIRRVTNNELEDS